MPQIEDAPGTVVISQQEYDKLRSENHKLRSRNERLEVQLSKSTQGDSSKLTRYAISKLEIQMATGGDLGIFVCLSTWSTLKGQKTSKSAFFRGTLKIT